MTQFIPLLRMYIYLTNFLLKSILHEGIAFKRGDFVHHYSHKIVDKYDIVTIERFACHLEQILTVSRFTLIKSYWR